MTQYRNVEHAGYFMGRLPKGSDLLETLEAFCTEKGITLGRVDALGAVEKARIGYYDQKERVYRYIDLDQDLEITSLAGNVSLKDGRSMVHAHITLADEKGAAFGGHLSKGTTVFACEFIIQAFKGPVLERRFDGETDLFLWGMD